jgi:ribosomal protein S27AE
MKMSRTVDNWKCNSCGFEQNAYVSFGEPETDFEVKWKCGKCKTTNTYELEAVPIPHPRGLGIFAGFLGKEVPMIVDIVAKKGNDITINNQ